MLVAVELLGLAERAGEILVDRDAARLAAAAATVRHTGVAGDAGVSKGRSGELTDELRIEAIDADLVRVGRWLLRPGTGWELADAPPMLPAARYAEALIRCAAQGRDPRSAPRSRHAMTRACDHALAGAYGRPERASAQAVLASSYT